MSRLGPLMRLMAVAVASVALAAAVGCGDSDDGESAAKDGQSSAQQAADTTQASAGSPEAQIRAAYERYVDAFYAKDPAAVCALLTEKIQKKLGNGITCEKRLKEFMKNKISPKRPYVTKVTFKGPNSATALVKTQTSKIYPVTYAKVDGEWKASGGIF